MHHKTQYRYPDQAAVRKMVEGIWDRKYYTNQGPLTNELEFKIQQSLGVRHAVVMTNNDIALLITLLALGEKNEALIPDCHPVYLKNALLRMQISSSSYPQDVFEGNEIKSELIAVSNNTIVFGFHAFGNAADVDRLTDYCSSSKCDLILVSDNLWKSYQSKADGKFRMVELFSLEQGQLVNGVEGSCLVTDDDDLAAKLRNIRSSYGAGRPVEIPFTGNGRMSEFQAGMAILSLERLEHWQQQLQQIKSEMVTVLEKLGIHHDDFLNTGSSYVAIRIKDINSKESVIREVLKIGYTPSDVHFILSTGADKNAEKVLLLLLNTGKS